MDMWEFIIGIAWALIAPAHKIVNGQDTGRILQMLSLGWAWSTGVGVIDTYS